MGSAGAGGRLRAMAERGRREGRWEQRKGSGGKGGPNRPGHEWPRRWDRAGGESRANRPDRHGGERPAPDRGTPEYRGKAESRESRGSFEGRESRGRTGAAGGRPTDAGRQFRAWQRPTGPGGPGSRQGPRPPYRPARPSAGPPPGRVPAGLLEHGEELVAGRRPVEEAFAAGRKGHRLLVAPQRRAALETIVLHATRERLPIVEVEGGTLTALAGFDGHQGVALVVGPRRWATLEEALARAIAQGEPPFLLALDSVEDPRNLGALLRSAEAAGVHGVLIPTRRAAPLTAVAVKASAGASEHLALVPVDDLPGALADLHGRGLRLVGADAEAALSYREADLRGPLAVVIGSEATGLSSGARRRLDLALRIPMHGRVRSLNAAAAASVLLFEVAAQRETPAPMRVADEEASSGQRETSAEA